MVALEFYMPTFIAVGGLFPAGVSTVSAARFLALRRMRPPVLLYTCTRTQTYEGNVNEVSEKAPRVGGGAYSPRGQGVNAQRKVMGTGLAAPFRIDFGGKSRLAPAIWERLGNPVVYVEPFAGSLACLLARPDGAGQREIVCDLDGGISNFWRAVTAEPDLVAAWADYPTFHADLTARHKWLRAWFAEHSAELSADPHFYCAKVAGWWVWGISLWIGGGWCNAVSEHQSKRRERPKAHCGITAAVGASMYQAPSGYGMCDRCGNVGQRRVGAGATGDNRFPTNGQWLATR